MNPKNSFTANRKYPLIRKELAALYGEEATKKILSLAQTHYASCEQLCQDAAEGEWQHLSGTILPTAAIYKALQQTDPENALTATHTVMMRMCALGGRYMGAALKIPGMKSLFMWLLPKMAIKLFGPACGFQFQNFESGKTVLKMDMTVCPYCRYAWKLNCPELMPVFCDSDVAVYGDLPGIRFQRTQTLGTVGSCCDFRFSRE